MNIRRLLCVGVCLSFLLCLTAEHITKSRQLVNHLTCDQWVDSLMSEMTLKQKVGQLFIYKVDPVAQKKNMDYVRLAISDYGIGGLLFADGDVEKQIKLTNMAQQCSDIPLLVAFDSENGLTDRLKNAPEFPEYKVLGCIQNDSLIYRYGREMARELHEIGVHVNFASLTDANRNQTTSATNIHLFDTNPQVVAHKVAAYTQGLEDGGVMAGILAEESKNQKVQALKKKLDFKGMMFVDTQETNDATGNESDNCIQTLMSGNDMLLAPSNLKRGMANVLQAVKSGKIKEAEIDAKCRKVLALKYRMGLNLRPVMLNESRIAEQLNTPETEKLQRELNRAAVTVVKDSVGVLPFDLSMSDNILLSIAPSLSSAYPFYHRLSQSLQTGWLHANADSLDYIEKRIRPAQQVIVAIHQKDCAGYVPLLEKVASEKPLTIVCFTSQEVFSSLGRLPELASAVVLAHTDTKVLQQQVSDMLTGGKVVDGRLAVGTAIWKSGTGITLDPDKPRSFRPENFGMNSSVLARIDTIVAEGIANKAFPGCHVLIMKEGCTVYNKCFGYFTYDNLQEVKENDLYDLASVTKVTGTLLAVMKLYDEGKFGLTDPIGKYVSELKGTDKESITIRELLFHESGLPAYLPFYEEAVDQKSCKDGLFSKKQDESHSIQVGVNQFVNSSFSYKKEWVSRKRSAEYPLTLSDGLYLNSAFCGEILKQIAGAPLKGHSYLYSCLNFMLLKEMSERISGVPMDAYLDSVFYKPMGLKNTMYNPLTRVKKNRIVPTLDYDFLRKDALQGYVNDPAAAFMGGVSGNAGLFSTTHDVGRIFQMLLDKGVCGNQRYLSRATCKLFLEMKAKGSRRGLGFDKPDVRHNENSPCAPETPASVFGHTGYTGTCVWADPENELVFVFLSNRTYPTDFDHTQLTKMNIRPRIQQAIYQSLSR